ncbi:MAG: hypothetical protein GX301_07545 [Gracilibacteraceae bacterium]|jgi:hypothetical protein|nr:hypothetical protein [Gracilibacteraceae bacterium]
MNCMHCENCKQNTPTYFCLARNEVIINENYVANTEKSRKGWKKGEPGYETHRRKLKKEIEV